MTANPKIISHFPKGVVAVPPSKSQAHRVIICALLSRGESFIENISFSQDILATLNAAAVLGASWSKTGENAVKIDGIGGIPQVQSGCIIPCGQSATTLRFLMPVAAALGLHVTFAGEGRLMLRPIDQYERCFAENGATIERVPDGISVKGKLCSGMYSLDGNVSSQFVSGLLLALPLLAGNSEITVHGQLESSAYVTMTADACLKFSVYSQTDGCGKYSIRGGQTYLPTAFTIEGDYSQAAYFLAAGALGADVACAGLSPDSLQPDKAILTILRRMGATVTHIADGAIKAYAKELYATDVDVSQTPDIAPPISALMCFARGKSRITGATRLRLKESDRLRSITGALRSLGADIIEEGDTLVITGRPSISGGLTDAYGDHRIAMMAALASLKCETPVTLTGWETIDKSYPNFWQDWEQQ